LCAAGRLLAANSAKSSALADPAARAKIVMAFVALVIAALGALVIVGLVGRYLRRQVQKPLRPTGSDEDAWYRKPLHPAEPTPRSDEPKA